MLNRITTLFTSKRAQATNSAEYRGVIDAMAALTSPTEENKPLAVAVLFAVVDHVNRLRAKLDEDFLNDNAHNFHVPSDYREKILASAEFSAVRDALEVAGKQMDGGKMKPEIYLALLDAVKEEAQASALRLFPTPDASRLFTAPENKPQDEPAMNEASPTP